MSEKHLVALINATSAAIEPALQGFIEEYPEATLWNILDDQLLPAADAAGRVTPELEARMQRLIRHALIEGADAVLLTCSMYGAVATNFTSMRPVLAPDETAFTDLLGSGYRSVLVMASLESALTDTQERLEAELTARGMAMDVYGVVVPGAFDAAKRGDMDGLAASMTSAAEAAADVDAVFLAQYSLSPARVAIGAAVGKPVIAGPPSAAAYLRGELAERAPAEASGRSSEPSSGSFGVIADDNTGAVDVATALSESGLSAVILFGTPEGEFDLPPHDAVVIAQKIRSVPTEKAVEVALESLRWLQAAGVTQVYYKYCSTFDSTPQGNIGPVVDALADAMGASLVVTTPSSPEHGRTLFQGQLFVNGVLLEDTHMATHPLTPMTESHLPTVLAPQSSHPVASLSWQTIRSGPQQAAAALAEHREWGVRHVVADAITDDDLLMVAEATTSEPLLAGAAGLARAVGTVRARAVEGRPEVRTATQKRGRAESAHMERSAILAGSCSMRTLEQINDFESRGGRSQRLDAGQATHPRAMADHALEWFDTLPEGTPALIYSSLPPEELSRLQHHLGLAEAAELFETALSLIAEGLVKRGVRRLVVAGGETSGAVVQALRVRSGTIGELAAPGVPWLHSLDEPKVSLLLKSGNFGEVELFTQVTQTQPKEQ